MRQNLRSLASLPPELLIGLALTVCFVLMAIFGSALSPHDPMQGDLYDRFAPLGTEGNWLGTDHLGRDLWARVAEGASWSIAVALVSNAISMAIGIALGLIAAERSGWMRTIFEQSVATVLAFPGLIIAICIVAVFGQGFWPLVLTLGLLTWPVIARIVYAEASSLFKRDYITAAYCMGASRRRVFLTHLIPALSPTLMVVTAFHFADMLIAESALSFLGIGAPLGAPTWGNMLAESRVYLFQAPGMLFVPAAAIVLAVLAANLLGQGLSARSMKRGRGLV